MTKVFLEAKETAVRTFLDHIRGDKKFFHPHELTYEALLGICEAVGRDYYGFLVYEDRILAYGMLRGWDEGYEVPSLGIAVAEKGRGAGRRMMNELHKTAVEMGAKRIRLTVMKENKVAVSLYKSMGYELTDKDDRNYLGTKKL